jgi:hypothetical protein
VYGKNRIFGHANDNGQLEIVKYIFEIIWEKTIIMNSIQNSSLITAFTTSIENGNLKIVKYLYSIGVIQMDPYHELYIYIDINIKSYLEANYRYPEVAKFILKYFL